MSVRGDQHCVKYIPGYTKHLFDSEYIDLLNKYLLALIGVWESKIDETVSSLDNDNWWSYPSIEDIRQFYTFRSKFNDAKRMIGTYEGTVVLQSMSKQAMANVLDITDCHLADLIYNFSLSTHVSVMFKPNLERRSFEIVTEFDMNRQRVWTFKKLRW